MDHYALEYQYPRKGFISGGATFTPEVEYYDPLQTDLPPHTTAEVMLDARLRKMDVDFFYTGTRATVVSDAFKQLLEEYHICAQFIPAQMYYHNGVPVPTTYWIVHRLQQLDVVNYEASDYAGKQLVLRSMQQPPRRIAKGFSRIVLDEQKIGTNELFTLEYTYISNPIISERLYEEIKKRKLRIHATPISDFQP